MNISELEYHVKISRNALRAKIKRQALDEYFKHATSQLSEFEDLVNETSEMDMDDEGKKLIAYCYKVKDMIRCVLDDTKKNLTS